MFEAVKKRFFRPVSASRPCSTRTARTPRRPRASPSSSRRPAVRSPARRPWCSPAPPRRHAFGRPARQGRRRGDHRRPPAGSRPGRRRQRQQALRRQREGRRDPGRGVPRRPGQGTEPDLLGRRHRHRAAAGIRLEGRGLDRDRGRLQRPAPARLRRHRRHGQGQGAPRQEVVRCARHRRSELKLHRALRGQAVSSRPRACSTPRRSTPSPRKWPDGVSPIGHVGIRRRCPTETNKN